MKIFTGKVLHTKMQKTAVVEVVRMMAHPIYGKHVKRTKKYLVHDEVGVKAGDTVKFVACRPVSKLKKWKIVGDKVEAPKKERISRPAAKRKK